MPVCGEWREFISEVAHGFDVALTSIYSIHLVGTIIALVLCCFNYKIMWDMPHACTAIMHPLILQSGIGIIFVVKCFTSVTYILRFKFPSILLVYYISIPIILDVTHFIGLAGRRSLFCRSDSLFDDPTPFCSFTGTELDLRLTSLYSFINFICLQLSPIYFYILL